MSAFPYGPKVKLTDEVEAILTARFKTAPTKPKDRPPTKAETWAIVHHCYHDLMKRDDLVDYARNRWAWDYAAWVNFRGWRKHPDWVEGDTVILQATIPAGEKMNGDMAPVHVQRLWQIVRNVAQSRATP